jgi:hypothetical protein
MLVDAGARGKPLLTVTKVWSPGTQADKDAWHLFALASFLMGTDGSAMFMFTYNETDEPTLVLPGWSGDIGLPTAPYKEIVPGTLFTRTFQRGRVWVNPSDTSVTKKLSQPFQTLAGDIITTLTLGPHSAQVAFKL